MMIFEAKTLSELSATDLEALNESQITEGKSLDYKRELPGSSDGDKKEFLFDISSFANAAGGYLVFGIEEEGGVPKSISGLTLTDPDAEIRRLESLILDGIEPRIPGVELRFIKTKDAMQVLVIKIPKSWLLPHMVIFRGTDKFYSRNSAGKYRLDVTELRSLFALAGNITDQIRKFRTERLSKIIADDTPVVLEPLAKIILHLVPLESFSTSTRINLETAHYQFPIPLGAPNLDSSRVNLDGLLNCGQVGKTHCYSYLQLFHNGIIETVDAYTLNANALSANVKDKLIPSTSFEGNLIQHIQKYLATLKTLGITPPIVIMLSLIGVRGFCMVTSNIHQGGYPIDRDLLTTPEIVLNKLECSPRDLKPILDSVWNASGIMSSPNFDASGQWRGLR